MMHYKKTLIGLTPSHDTQQDDLTMRPTYLRALQTAGAIPVILPLHNTPDDVIQLADTFDGFLFTGGPDVHPFLYGEETHEHCGSISPERDALEMELLRQVMERKKPVLGVCRGIQMMNAALGGTLWQDIPSQVQRRFSAAHSQNPRYDIPCHYVDVKPGSLLAAITGKERLAVNSMHHQAVKDLAPGLTASGYSPDGLIEAVEMDGFPFFLGVQWHPEYLWEKDEVEYEILKSFVRACAVPGS